MRGFDVMEVAAVEPPRISPMAMVQAAEADLKRRRDNSVEAKMGGSNYALFAFHRKHVHGSVSAHQIIRRALAERELGIVSGKRNTRIIYRDEPGLQLALEMAR